MGPPIADPVKGGSRCEDIGAFLHRVSPYNPIIWVRNEGHYPSHGEDPGEVPPMGGETFHIITTPVLIRQEL